MKKIKNFTHSDTFWPVVASLALMAALLLLPTGYEGALSYQNADRVSALVLSTDESDIYDTGLVRTGDQRCRVRILGGRFAGTETDAVNRLSGSLAQDKLFSVWVSLCLVMVLTALILMLIYGWDRRFLAAVSGAALGILVTAVLGAVFTDLFQIHGAVMESSESLLYAGYQHLDLTKIFIASIFLGSSGAVMDLSVDICSAVYEVVQKKPDIRAREAVAPLTAITSGLLLTHRASPLPPAR